MRNIIKYGFFIGGMVLILGTIGSCDMEFIELEKAVSQTIIGVVMASIGFCVR